MEYKKLDKKKGVVGLEILVAIITSIFMIGMIVMAFVVAGSQLKATLTDTSAQDVVNTTYNSISGVTTWFGTFIVLGAVIVLVLMIVLLVRALRGSGMAGGA